MKQPPLQGVRVVICAWNALLVTWVVTAAACVDPDSGGSVDAARWVRVRERMVREQLRARDITDARVLAVMGELPRHAFVPPAQQEHAYGDYPIPIGGGQTISQPYVVALMTQLLGLRGGERVLEIGTGSGYQAAVLSRLAGSVYSIEIDPVLADGARRRLAELDFANVHVRTGDGFFGWPEAAPFDAIIITAAAPRVPETLLDQLRDGGRLVAPIHHGGVQELRVGVKQEGKLRVRSEGAVLFVPMTGEVERTSRRKPPADSAEEKPRSDDEGG